MIVVDSVSKTYTSGIEEVHAVDRVSFAIEPGQLVTLYGASGSGKTTLTNLIAGLDEADSGTVRVAGVEIGTLDEDQRAAMRRETIGVVFQDHNLIAEFTAAENVSLPQVAGGAKARTAKSDAEGALHRVGLEGLGDRFPDQLSGGQRQRVGVARAFVGARKVLIADEPTGALDTATSESLFALLRELANGGLTVVVATHDPLARRYADRVFSIVDGAVSEELVDA